MCFNFPSPLPVTKEVQRDAPDDLRRNLVLGTHHRSATQHHPHGNRHLVVLPHRCEQVGRHPDRPHGLRRRRPHSALRPSGHPRRRTHRSLRDHLGNIRPHDHQQPTERPDHDGQGASTFKRTLPKNLFSDLFQEKFCKVEAIYFELESSMGRTVDRV